MGNNDLTAHHSKNGANVFFALLLVLTVVMVSSCTQKVYIPIKLPPTWKITFINEPATAGESYSDSYTGKTYTLSEPSAIDGYEFGCFRMMDGTELQPGDKITYSGDNIVIYVVWTPIITVDTSAGSTDVISSAIQDLSAGRYIINLPKGNFVESNPITITAGQDILIRGESAEATTLSTEISIAEGASLSVENATLLQNTANNLLRADENNDIIHATTGDVSISLKSCVLNVNEKGAAIDVTVPVDEEHGEVQISLEDTRININQAAASPVGAARGIDINSYDYNASSPFAGRISSLILDINDSYICQNENDTTGSVIGVCISNVDYMDVDINNSIIKIKDTGTHYAICIDTCGTSEKRSAVDINDSALTGWYCIFLRDNCIGFDINVKNSDLTTINSQSGNYNGISVLQMNDCENCSLTADNVHFTFGTTDATKAEGLIFGFQYNNGIKVLGGGNSFHILNSDFELYRSVESPLKVAAIDNFDFDTGYTENTYEIDQVSLKNLLNLLPGTSLTPRHTHGKYTADNYDIDFCEFFLAKEGDVLPEA